MYTESSRSHVSASNFNREPISDHDLIRGFELSLGASGRSPKTLHSYTDSIKALSAFARQEGLPPLAVIDREHVRFWLVSLHNKGNKPGTVHLRYRGLNRFFRWCVEEEERQDNPMDRIDPPRIPNTIQPYYSPEGLQKVLKFIGRRSRRTRYDLRDKAIILTLFDTGVRAAELSGMREHDLDWADRTILVPRRVHPVAPARRVRLASVRRPTAAGRRRRRARKRPAERALPPADLPLFRSEPLRPTLPTRSLAPPRRLRQCEPPSDRGSRGGWHSSPLRLLFPKSRRRCRVAGQPART